MSSTIHIVGANLTARIVGQHPVVRANPVPDHVMPDDHVIVVASSYWDIELLDDMARAADHRWIYCSDMSLTSMIGRVRSAQRQPCKVMVSSDDLAWSLLHSTNIGQVYNVSGLIWASDAIANLEPRPWASRAKRVILGSWTAIHQPNFFLDLVDMWYEQGPCDVEFVILNATALHLQDPTSLSRALDMQTQGKVRILDAVDRKTYFDIMQHGRVLVDCGLGGATEVMCWADSLGLNLLVPACHGKAEFLAHDPNRLYVPWSIDDAFIKLTQLIERQHHNVGLASAWSDRVVDRMVEVIDNPQCQWLRDIQNCPAHFTQPRYHVVKIEE